MSKIGTILNTLIDTMQSALPDHAELTDFEDISNNDGAHLRRGFTARFADGFNTDRCITDQNYFLARNFDLVVSGEVLATELDAKSKRDCYIDVMENFHLLLKSVCQQFTIEPDIAFKLKYVSDSGPILLYQDNEQYVYITAKLEAEYSESTA